MKSYKILMPVFIFLSFFAACEEFTDPGSDESDSRVKKDGLYSGGAYTQGTQYSSFTISSTTTKVNI